MSSSGAEELLERQLDVIRWIRIVDTDGRIQWRDSFDRNQSYEIQCKRGYTLMWIELLDENEQVKFQINPWTGQVKLLEGDSIRLSSFTVTPC